jgi:hypothetical protein
MVRDVLAAGTHEPDATRATDRGAAALMLVVGRDVPDGGVQAHVWYSTRTTASSARRTAESVIASSCGQSALM